MPTLTRNARPDRPGSTVGPNRHSPRRYRPGPAIGPAPRAPKAPPRPLDADQQARAEQYMPLAHRLAWYYARRRARWVPADELVSEALYGLAYAAARFNPARGVPFAAYAIVVIRRRLVILARGWFRGRPVNLSALEADAGDQADINTGWVADPTPGPAELAGQRDECDQVRRVLPAKWFDVLVWRFAEGQTHDGIGDRLGVARQAVQQAEGRALKRCRRQLRGGLEA
jgi:RNA polymerase sigma factor (sigma-70 family)